MPPHTPGKLGPPAGLFFPSGDRSARPLPPLPSPLAKDLSRDEMDQEVEFLTSSDTDPLLEGQRASGPASHPRRRFAACGQINFAYDDPAPKEEEEQQPAPVGPQPPPCQPPPPQLHRRLRRSHSGPAGAFHKPVARAGGARPRRASPSSDEEKPEVPPRAPIPPRALKPDYRRWSAEVAGGAYSDEERPPKVPPREPLARGGSRTPSPKSLPSYLNGVMPPTQSFAPDPKYVSSKALQRQHSEGSAHRAPCILPIIEDGRKASSTHYYLLPERPPYLDRYERFFREAEEAPSAEDPGRGQPRWAEPEDVAALPASEKRKPLSCAASP